MALPIVNQDQSAKFTYNMISPEYEGVRLLARGLTNDAMKSLVTAIGENVQEDKLQAIFTHILKESIIEMPEVVRVTDWELYEIENFILHCVHYTRGEKIDTGGIECECGMTLPVVLDLSTFSIHHPEGLISEFKLDETKTLTLKPFKILAIIPVEFYAISQAALAMHQLTEIDKDGGETVYNLSDRGEFSADEISTFYKEQLSPNIKLQMANNFFGKLPFLQGKTVVKCSKCEKVHTIKTEGIADFLG